MDLLIFVFTPPLPGFFMIQAVTEAQNQTLGQYAAAGGLATESLGAVRTVSALNAQPDVINKYRIYLFEAMHVSAPWYGRSEKRTAHS